MAVSEILREPETGKPSASRVLMMFWGLGVLVAWFITSVQLTELATIPESVVTILGLVVGGKAVQRFGEGKNPNGVVWLKPKEANEASAEKTVASTSAS